MQQFDLPVSGAAPPLAVRRFLPPAGMAAQGSVVIGAAFCVPQTFYAPFAQWLATQGWAVTTFDYRGQGASLHGPMRAVRADLHDWVRDYGAVIAHAADALPGRLNELNDRLEVMIGADEIAHECTSRKRSMISLLTASGGVALVRLLRNLVRVCSILVSPVQLRAKTSKGAMSRASAACNAVM